MSWPLQFFRFAAVGAMGTSVHYAMLIILVLLLDLSPTISAMLGATLGALTNYFLNYHFTFKASRLHREALPRFFAIAVIGIALNGLLVKIIISFSLHFLVAQLFATLIILFINYLLSRLWVFQKLP